MSSPFFVLWKVTVKPVLLNHKQITAAGRAWTAWCPATAGHCPTTAAGALPYPTLPCPCCWCTALQLLRPAHCYPALAAGALSWNCWAVDCNYQPAVRQPRALTWNMMQWRMRSKTKSTCFLKCLRIVLFWLPPEKCFTNLLSFSRKHATTKCQINLHFEKLSQISNGIQDELECFRVLILGTF